MRQSKIKVWENIPEYTIEPKYDENGKLITDRGPFFGLSKRHKRWLNKNILFKMRREGLDWYKPDYIIDTNEDPNYRETYRERTEENKKLRDDLKAEQKKHGLI